MPFEDCDELIELKAKLKRLDDAIFISETIIREWFKNMVPKHCIAIDTIEGLECALTIEKESLEELKNDIPPDAKWYHFSKNRDIVLAKETYAKVKKDIEQLERSIYGYKTYTNLDDEIKGLVVLKNCREHVQACITETHDKMYKTLCKEL